MSAGALSTEIRLFESVSRGARAILVLIEAYVDESGTGDADPALCLAGYIIKPDQGPAMIERWQAVLDEYQIPFFHMTDCAHYEVCEPYKSLGREKCIKLATKLIEIIKAHCASGFSIVFDARKFAPPTGIGLPDDIGYSPYSCAVSLVHAQIQATLQFAGYEGDRAYIFEAGHRYQKLARLALDRLLDTAEAEGVPFNYSFQTKRSSCLLQAADILAWHSQMHIKRKLKGNPIRKDFRSLLEIPHDMLHFSNSVDNGVIDESMIQIVSFVSENFDEDGFQRYCRDFYGQK